mmetsp:Transcript_15108/g.22149  ORF Transcript_15108/g.22149 Transcript_15108/m.22149 type:complete len:84 (-) Transcript_15108:125-376(-)
MHHRLDMLDEQSLDVVDMHPKDLVKQIGEVVVVVEQSYLLNIQFDVNGYTSFLLSARNFRKTRPRRSELSSLCLRCTLRRFFC